MTGHDEINDLHAEYYKKLTPVPGQSPGTTREKHKDAVFIRLLTVARKIVEENNAKNEKNP